MKIRAGFVSNSSSSSFVACLPDNFDINVIDFEKWSGETERHMGRRGQNVSAEDVKKMVEDLIRTKGCCSEDAVFGIAREIFQEYIISEVDTSSEYGSFVFLDSKQKQKLREILK